MTRRLAGLADIAYRRRGRLVLGWIGAAILLIGEAVLRRIEAVNPQQTRGGSTR